MTEEEVKDKLINHISDFEIEYGCTLLKIPKANILDEFSGYIEFLNNLNDSSKVELITNAGIEYSRLKARAVEAQPLTPGGFKFGGDRSKGYRRSLDAKDENDQEDFTPVNTKDLDEDKEWMFTGNHHLINPIDKLHAYKKKLFEKKTGDFSELFPSNPESVELLKKFICSITPFKNSEQKIIKVKWWENVQVEKHKLAFGGFSIKNGLRQDCLGYIRESINKYKLLSTNDTVEKIFEGKDHWYEIVDGEEKEINSFPTLRRRIKKYYPDIYRELHKK